MIEIIESLKDALTVIRKHKYEASEAMLFDTALMFLYQEYAILDMINKLEYELYSVEA